MNEEKLYVVRNGSYFTKGSLVAAKKADFDKRFFRVRLIMGKNLIGEDDDIMYLRNAFLEEVPDED